MYWSTTHLLNLFLLNGAAVFLHIPRLESNHRTLSFMISFVVKNWHYFLFQDFNVDVNAIELSKAVFEICTGENELDNISNC